MTSHDQLKTSGLLGELLILLVTDVSDGSNASDVCCPLNEVNCILNSLDGITEFGSSSWGRNGRGLWGGDSDDSKSVLLVDVERFDGGIENGVIGLNVGRDDRDVREVLQEGTKFVISSVELVVTEGHSVETKLVEGLCNLLTSIV